MNILMMRHSYDDHSYIDGKNDTPLTSYGVQLANDTFEHLAPNLKALDSKFNLYVSNKIRALETASILSEYMDKQHIPHEITVTPGYCELYQGEMVDAESKTHEHKIKLLELGWEIFDKQRISGDDNYKFGTPDYSDEKYHEFNNLISFPYGESQNELSQRIHDTFIETVKKSHENSDTPLIVAHRGTIREILNIVIAHNRYSYEAIQDSSVEMSGWKYCQLFTTELDNVNFTLSALKKRVREQS